MSALFQMRPSLAGCDAMNLGLKHSEASGDFALRHSAKQGFDLKNVRFGEFRHAVKSAFAGSAASIGIGMKAILAASAPLKVIRTVIGLVAVNMIDFVQRRWLWRQKHRRNQSVNQPYVIFPVQKERGSNISSPVVARGKNYRLSLNRANFTIIRYFIVSFKTKDRAPRNRHANPPLFDTLREYMAGISLQHVIKGDLQ